MILESVVTCLEYMLEDIKGHDPLSKLNQHDKLVTVYCVKNSLHSLHYVRSPDNLFVF